MEEEKAKDKRKNAESKGQRDEKSFIIEEREEILQVK